MAAKKTFVFETDEKSLANEYLTNRKSEYKKIVEDFQKGNFINLGIIGGRMKGSAGSYGYDELGVLGEELETASQLQNHKRITDVVRKIRDFLDKHLVKEEDSGKSE